jgi:hypothetical protein
MLAQKSICALDHTISGLVDINLDLHSPEIARAVRLCQTTRALLIDVGADADINRLAEFMQQLQILLALVMERARLAQIMAGSGLIKASSRTD